MATGVDCLGIVLHVLRSAGHELPDPRLGGGGEAQIRAFARHWRPIEKPERALDLIHTLGTNEDGVWVVLEGGYWCITATPEPGVTMEPVATVARRAGARFYRLKDDPDEPGQAAMDRCPSATFAVSLLISAILVGATYAITAATAPNPPDRRRQRDSAIYGFDGIVNTRGAREKIPIVYGAHRVGGHVIASFQSDPLNGPFLDAEEAAGVLNTLLSVSSGGEYGIEDITDFRIDRNPAANFPSAIIEKRLGVASQAPISGFDDIRVQHLKGDTLTNSGGALTYTTIDEVDAFEVVLSFPLGLIRFDNAGNERAHSVTVLVEYRLAGSSDEWTRVVVQPISGRTNSEKREFIQSPRVDRAKYEVRITRVSVDDNGTTKRSEINIFAITEITEEKLTYPGVATYAVRQLPTSQFSGRTPTYDALVLGRKVRIYSDETTYTVAWSDNPAWCLLDFLTDPRDGLGPLVPRERIIMSDFLEWAAFCAELVDLPGGVGGQEPRFCLNYVIDGTETSIDVIKQIAATGRAFPRILGDRWGIVIDRAEPPSQFFSMGRIREGSFKVSKPATQDKPNTLIGEFFPADLEYEAESLPFQDPLLGPEEEIVESSLSLAGTTSRSQAHRHLAYHTLKARLEQREVELEAGVWSIKAEAGQVARVTHDVPLWGFSGQLRRVEGNIVYLDRDVTIEAGKAYELTIAHPTDTGDSVSVAVVANPPETTDRILLTQGLAEEPEAGADYSFGEVTKSTALYRIMSISRGSQPWLRKVKLRQYDARVYEDDLSALPTPSISALPDERVIPPAVTDLRLFEDQVYEPDGTLSARINVHFRLPSVAGVTAKVYFREVTTPAGLWEFAGETRAGFFAVGGIQAPGVTYEVSVVTCSSRGNCGHPDNGARGTLTTAGVTRQPDDVTGFAVDRTFDGLVFTWTALDPVDNFDLSHYEIRQGTSWGTAVPLGRTAGKETEFRTTKFSPSIDATSVSFHIKAVNSAGNPSAQADTAVLLVEGRINENIIFTQQEDTTFPGTKVNCSVDTGKLVFDTPSGVYTTAKFQVSATEPLRSLIYTSIDADQINKTLTWNSSEVTNETWDGTFASMTTWSGSVGLDDTVRLFVEMRFSTTDSADASFGPWQERSQGLEASVKWAQARVTVAIEDPNFRVEISKLRFLFDVPDLFDSGSETTSGSGTVSVSFNRTFHAEPNLTATVINPSAGDEVEVTNKDKDGFDLGVKNSGSYVARTVNWQAKGY